MAVGQGMRFEAWVLVISGLLLLMGLGAAYVKRLPFTATMVYLGIGALLGPLGFAVLRVDPMTMVELFHRAAEVTVVVSLFTVGLKLRLPWRDPRWRPALWLAFGSMALTVALITAVGVAWLDWPLGAAVLLGAVLAPTDPVLASDVQLSHPNDRDKLRLALSGEAGFNDGTAFPFVMLGLGLLGVHELGAGGWRWWTVDVVWAIVGGLAIGGGLGTGVAKLILRLRLGRAKGASIDEYLLLGLIGLSYGTALILHAYGFLAVFAAGLAVRAIERRAAGVEPEGGAKVINQVGEARKAANHPRLAPAYLAGSFLAFNEQLERILEVGMVLLVGAGLASLAVPAAAIWFVPLLFLIVRPLAVLPVWRTGRFSRAQFAGIAWFGMRGIGSIYYVMYAVTRGIEPELARDVVGMTFAAVAASIVVHGVSVTPLLPRISRGP